MFLLVRGSLSLSVCSTMLLSDCLACSYMFTETLRRVRHVSTVAYVQRKETLNVSWETPTITPCQSVSLLATFLGM